MNQIQHLKNNAFVKWLYYGNYFYGLCAVAMCMETQCLFGFGSTSIYFYTAVYCGTVIFYSYPYLQSNSPTNERLQWYAQHKRLVYYSLCLLSLLLLLSVGIIMYKCYSQLHLLNTKAWVVISSTIAIALAYYGSKQISLRHIGWLKPFVVAFVWANVSTLMPVIYYTLLHNMQFKVYGLLGLFWANNFAYIAILCVLFDNKDVQTDTQQHIKTYIIKYGFAYTKHNIIQPLLLFGVGIVSIIGYTFYSFSIAYLLWYIPYLVLYILLHTKIETKSLLYYLVVVDGMLLLKALCIIYYCK